MEKELETGEKTENKTDNKTEQNNRRYKAFISYRHQPFDRKVAVTLQKHLETFHPPKQLEKKEKWRVFRDETELPTSADLSQDIREALENSEYLIVICSSMLAQSKWCREEISYFKSLHNNSTQNILALLIEGNPGDVFPEELCWSEEIRKNAEGEEIREKIEVEPLAANITADSERKSLKKLKTEYLRIAAPLLGCRYDDLYQREQKRKIHRSLAVMGGVTVVVGGIGIYSSIMAVRLNEQKRLLQEENYNRMAVQSDYMWEDGKVTEAIETAVDALPDTEDNMSVFSAEKATAEKLGVFQRENFLPIQKYETTSYITKVAFVNGGKNVVAQDATGVYLWETKSGKLVKKYTKTEMGFESSSWDLDLLLDKEKPLEDIKLQKNVSGGNAMTDGGGTNELMLYGYKKIMTKGEAQNSYFYLTCEKRLWRVNSETGEYESFEKVDAKEKEWHYNSETYAYEYRKIDGQFARDYQEYKENEEIPGLWEETGKHSLIVYKENDSNQKETYNYEDEKYFGYFYDEILSISEDICYVNISKYDDNGDYSDKIIAYAVENQTIMRNKSPLLEETIEEHSKDDMSWITSPEKESFRYAERIGDYFVVRSVYGTNEEYCKYRVYDYKTAKKISEITVNAYTCYKDEKSALIFKKEDTNNYTDVFLGILNQELILTELNTGKLIYEYTFPTEIIKIRYLENGIIFVSLKNGKEYMLGIREIEGVKNEKGYGWVIQDFEKEIDLCESYENNYIGVRSNKVYLYQDLENQNAEEIEEDKVLLYQTQNKNVKYPDYTQSKTIKPVIEDLQKQGLISEVMWSYKIGDKIFLYGRDGVFYKINEELSTVEEKITLKEETEENKNETSEDITVWRTQNQNEILLEDETEAHNRRAWLINLDKMEIRYEIGDDVKGQFAGYSQKENKVLMENWLEEKYWLCPLYTAEELKELGTKWKNQTD